jgi:hypothetical protein
MKQDPSSFSGPRPLPSCILPATRYRPGAARPCSPDSDGTRSFAPRSPARKSAPAPLGAPSVPPGHAPWESPRDAFLCSPVCGSSDAESLAGDSFPPAARAPAFPGLLPSAARTRPPSHGPLPPLRGWPSLAQRLSAEWAERRPCPSGCTTCLPSLPVREPSTSVPSKPRLPPMPIEPEFLRRV